MRHLDVHQATFVMNGPDGSTVKVKWLILTGYVTSGEDPTTRNGEVSRPSIMARHNGVAQKGCQYFEDRVSNISVESRVRQLLTLYTDL